MVWWGEREILYDTHIASIRFLLTPELMPYPGSSKWHSLLHVLIKLKHRSIINKLNGVLW